MVCSRVAPKSRSNRALLVILQSMRWCFRYVRNNSCMSRSTLSTGSLSYASGFSRPTRGGSPLRRIDFWSGPCVILGRGFIRKQRWSIRAMGFKERPRWTSRWWHRQIGAIFWRGWGAGSRFFLIFGVCLGEPKRPVSRSRRWKRAF